MGPIPPARTSLLRTTLVCFHVGPLSTIHRSLDGLKTKDETEDLTTHLVEIDIVVKWNHNPQLGPAPKPCYGVPADRQENEGHVEFGGLGGTLSRGHAVAHHMENCSVLVLNELPCEEPSTDGEPQQDDPNPLPVVLEKVPHLPIPPSDRVRILCGNQLLAQELAQNPAIRGPLRGLARPLQEQHFQARDLPNP